MIDCIEIPHDFSKVRKDFDFFSHVVLIKLNLLTDFYNEFKLV